MSQLTNQLYLGYNNSSRKAISINGHDIVVLLRGQQSTVLQGEEARLFRLGLAEISQHFCGIKENVKVQTALSRTKNGTDGEVYNMFFDAYHHHA